MPLQRDGGLDHPHARRITLQRDHAAGAARFLPRALARIVAAIGPSLGFPGRQLGLRRRVRIGRPPPA
jgi:hypothetical protein